MNAMSEPLLAAVDGAAAVQVWVDDGDVVPWVEACWQVRRELADPYGRSREYGVFVAASVLELTPDQQVGLRRATRPALAERLRGLRGGELIPKPEPMAEAGRVAASSYLATLTCGSAADEYAPLLTLVGMAAELMAAPSTLLGECFIEWDWSEREVQAWGRLGTELLAEISALAATNSAAIEGWQATADQGPQDQPIHKIAATDALAELRCAVDEMKRRLDVLGLE